MGKYNGAVITTAGQNLIAQAIAESKTVTFTTAQASSHAYPSSTDFEVLTALTDVEKTVDINYAGVYSDTVVQVSARFDNTGVDTAYLINTLGFFAQLGTDTPILFAVSTAVTPDQMPIFDADSPSAFIYNMQITVQNADSINLSVNPAGTVTVDQLNTAVSTLQTQINGKVNLSGIIDNLNETSAVSGDVLSAHQGNVIAKMIAPIEINQSSASQGYAIGEQFILNGLLSKATAAISQGAAFVLDGNYKLADSVTNQIIALQNRLFGNERFALSAVSDNQTDFYGFGYYDKSNHTVRIYLASRATAGVDSSRVATGIPAAYRPSSNRALVGIVNEIVTGRVIVNALNGEITQSMAGTYTSVFVVGEYSL